MRAGCGLIGAGRARKVRATKRIAEPMLARLTLAVMLAAATAGCAVSPLTFNRPYPVSGNPVNPTPTPDYRVVCSTWPVGSIGHCYQEWGAPAATEVIRVRG